MTVVLINPNSTESMTRSALELARAAAPGLRFEGWTNHGGPPAIQGEADGRACVPPLLELVRKADAEGAEAIVIACFDDTGLAEARAIARCPVRGIGEAAYTAATARGGRFSVVTTLAVSIPVIEGNIRAGGFGPALARVRASGVPVLALETDPEGSLRRIAEEIAEIEATGEADSVVLGCSGMGGFAEALRGRTSLAVLDGTACAALQLEQALGAPSRA